MSLRYSLFCENRVRGILELLKYAVHPDLFEFCLSIQGATLFGEAQVVDAHHRRDLQLGMGVNNVAEKKDT